MKIIATLLLVIGLILAPAYWIYTKFYTGSQAAQLTLDKIAANNATGSLWRSAPFELNTGMAPVGLILHVNTHSDPTTDDSKPPIDRYLVTLLKQGEAAKPLGIVLKASNSADGTQQFKEHLVFMQVVQNGSYQVEIAPQAETLMPVDRMQLEIRQNLREPNPHVVTSGIVLLVLGLLGLIAF